MGAEGPGRGGLPGRAHGCPSPSRGGRHCWVGGQVMRVAWGLSGARRGAIYNRLQNSGSRVSMLRHQGQEDTGTVRGWHGQRTTRVPWTYEIHAGGQWTAVSWGHLWPVRLGDTQRWRRGGGRQSPPRANCDLSSGSWIQGGSQTWSALTERPTNGSERTQEQPLSGPQGTCHH